MSDKKVFLKTSVKAEPLIWQWYAWPQIVAPLTAAMNVCNRHIKLLSSYIEAPEIHKMASNNPLLLGGSFVNLDEERVEEVNNLLQQTKNDCAELIELAHDIQSFDQLFIKEAKGGSLENFYEKLPKNLKGGVELTYNLNNQPLVRYFEPIFYKRFYNPSSHTIALSDTQEDFRPFSLSTPRLKNTNELFLKIPFSDSRIDHLFSMRSQPKSFKETTEMFEISGQDYALFSSFFTETSPPLEKMEEIEGVRIRYFGHACVLIQTESTSILIDPLVSYKVFSPLLRYTFDDLPDEIDYVLFTHNHDDHVVFETLLQLRHKVKHFVFPSNNKGFLADPSLKLILKHLGFSSLLSLEHFDSFALKEGEIITIPFLGEHSDLDIHSKTAYYIILKRKKFFFAADSNNLDNTLYEEVFSKFGKIDLLFLGMECEGAPLTWLYGPLLTHPVLREHNESRRLSGSNFKKTKQLVKTSGCKEVCIYAMGQEPWLNHIMAIDYSQASPQILESNKLIESCKEEGIKATRPYGQQEWRYR